MNSRVEIAKQIKRLKRVADALPSRSILFGEAYEAYHALRWVIEDVDWNPARMAEVKARKNGHLD